MDTLKDFSDYALNQGWCVDGESTHNGFLFYDAQTNERWIGWQAAKSKATYKEVVLNGHDFKYVSAFMDYEDPQNLDTEVVIRDCAEGFDGAGLYAWVAEYPEEGGIKLGEAQEPIHD